MTTAPINDFTLYVPALGSSLSRTLARGSAIVSDANEAPRDGLVVIYFEGNIFGAVNLVEYPDRVLNAAGRLRENYPTSAMQGAYLSDLVAIGTFHYPTRGLLIENRAALQEWLTPAKT